MGMDDWRVQQIEASREAKDWSRAQLWRQIKKLRPDLQYSRQALNKYLKRDSVTTDERALVAAEQLLGLNLRLEPDAIPEDGSTLSSSKPSELVAEGARSRPAPMIDPRYLPPLQGVDELRKRLSQSSHGFVGVPGHDPDAFVLVVPDGHPHFRAGVRIVISPGTQPISGCWAAVISDGKLELAEYLESDTLRLARLPSGRLATRFEVAGTAIWQSLL